MAPPADSIVHKLPWIDEWFSADTVEGIDASLARAATAAGDAPRAAYARELLRELRRASPTSLKVGLEALRRNKRASLRDCLRTEFRLVCRFMEPGSDFYEGVRAQLVDKTGAPAWKPAALADVTPERVAAFFEPLPPGEELDIGGAGAGGTVAPPQKGRAKL